MLAYFEVSEIMKAPRQKGRNNCRRLHIILRASPFRVSFLPLSPKNKKLSNEWESQNMIRFFFFQKDFWKIKKDFQFDSLQHPLLRISGVLTVFLHLHQASVCDVPHFNLRVQMIFPMCFIPNFWDYSWWVFKFCGFWFGAAGGQGIAPLWWDYWGGAFGFGHLFLRIFGGLWWQIRS